MSFVTYPHFCRDDVELGLSTPSPSSRTRSAVTLEKALTVGGGGLLFAAAIYLMIVLLCLF